MPLRVFEAAGARPQQLFRHENFMVLFLQGTPPSGASTSNERRFHTQQRSCLSRLRQADDLADHQVRLRRKLVRVQMQAL